MNLEDLTIVRSKGVSLITNSVKKKKHTNHTIKVIPKSYDM